MREYKIMLVGESEVGKTAIKECFCTGKCPNQYVQTNVPTFEEKNIVVDGSSWTVVVCDMPSANDEEQFLDSFFSLGPKMGAIIVVYDTSNRNSFKRIPHHLRKMKEIFMARNGGVEDLSKEPIYMLVGNKRDLARNVEMKEGKDLASLYEVPFQEVSALDYNNIDSMFATLVGAIEKKKKSVEHPPRIEAQHQQDDMRPIAPSSPPILEPYPYEDAAKFMFYISEANADGSMFKACAVAIEPQYLVTFRHGTHLNYETAITQFTIYHSSDEAQKNGHLVMVVDINEQFDFVLLKSENPLIKNAPPIAEASIGDEIRVLGYGNHHQKLWNLTGQIHLGKIQTYAGVKTPSLGPFFLGTVPTWQGDSGASCWNSQGIVGMNVSMMKIHPDYWHKHTEIFDNVALYYGRNCISSIDEIITSIKNHKTVVESEKEKRAKRPLDDPQSTVFPQPVEKKTNIEENV